jgi:hypothetical protein
METKMKKVLSSLTVPFGKIAKIIAKRRSIIFEALVYNYIGKLKISWLFVNNNNKVLFYYLHIG